MQAPAMPTLPLRDIKLPPEPGFWPLAPGWWVVIALLFVGLIWLTILAIKHQKKKRRWQAIDQQLSQIEFDFNKHQDSQILLVQLSEFLRRFVKFHLRQSQASALDGKQWVIHLNQLQGNDAFVTYSESLTTGVYQKHHDFDSAGLLETTRSFIKQQVMKPNKKLLQATKETKHV